MTCSFPRDKLETSSRDGQAYHEEVGVMRIGSNKLTDKRLLFVINCLIKFIDV